MRFQFTKMQGLGNDFVVVDNVDGSVELAPEQVKHIARRRFGVGCDQLLLVERPRVPDAHFLMRVFNADGSEVEQCGNGARCVTAFVRRKGLTDAGEILLETLGGQILSRIEPGGQVSVGMGWPGLEPADVPILMAERAPVYSLRVMGDVVDIGAVSIGNPHAVLRVTDVSDAPVASLGPLIQGHDAFPKGANVGFMEVAARDHIRLRVYERGAGETLACGTGACAAVVVGRQQGLLAEAVKVDLKGGRLHIRWEEGDSQVWMTGPAEWVFEGVMEL